MSSPTSTVQTLLDAAGISCSASELEQLVERYVALREQVDALYDAPYPDADPLFILPYDG